MKTTIYLIRHSLKFSNDLIKEYNTIQNSILKSEKIVLSVSGEKRALELSKIDELKNLDIVYTSNCVRTLETAKYIIEDQKLNVIIDERLDEKRVGKSNEDKYPDWFIYFWTKHHLDRFIRIAKDKAVTMGHIKRGDLGKAEVFIPEEGFMKRLDTEISPLLSEYVERRIENRKLQILRDSLLPELMSGQLTC